MQKIAPYLWFDSQAEEAANFYVSVFKKDSKIVSVSRYGEVGPGPKGSVMEVNFDLNGQRFMALNGGPEFTFIESVSFLIACEDQDEVDYYWEKLSEGGAPGVCGWLKDKYGLSWQVIPNLLEELVSDPDPEKSGRVMKAMLQMKKIDSAELQRAYDQN
jgi:predicted 3-demethylubiquinone-9 3-methyltransferase (glyoxalase superfamily)